nr:unnamed protein product [Callosobruchus analis]
MLDKPGREQRALWDVRSKKYSNKHVKRETYAMLVKKTKDAFPAADEKFVKSENRKFKSLILKRAKKSDGSEKNRRLNR